MRHWLLCLLLFPPLPALADSFSLSADDWARPRNGTTLAHQPALAGAMQAFERERDAVLVIAHATGEAGELWAGELRAWLVALGVSSARIHFEAHTDVQGALVLDVRKRSSL